MQWEFVASTRPNIAPTANPNIQTSFEYMANTIIASMSHKQLWTCLNPKCLELGYGRSKSNEAWADSGEDYLCDCGSRKVFCKYEKEEKASIEDLQYELKKKVKEELNRYSHFYKKYYNVDMTLRHEHVSTVWNKIFYISDVDFTLDLINSKNENNYVKKN
mgnify:FL=1